MKNKFKGLYKLGFLAMVAFAPFVTVFAQSVQGGGTTTSQCPDPGTLMYVLCRVSLLINSVIPVLIALGVVYFIYGVISYAIAKDEEAKTTGRSAMIYGLIALLVIVSIWGLISIVKRTFGVNDPNDTIQVPCIESPGIVCPQ